MPPNNNISSQKAKRAAVARIKQQVLISSKRYRTGEEPEYRVLVRGQYYDVGPRGLMGLAPVEDGE